MTQAEKTGIAAALQRALAEGQIPDRLQAAAGTLMERLTRPVRVTLFGLPGAGKSSVLNLLLGSQVVPAGAALPALQISGGSTAGSRCTLPDGSRVSLPGFDPAAIAARAPVFVEAELPLPALNQIGILEVVAPDAAALERAIPWAADKTDIALWCTQTFSAAEQAAWAGAPDQMKDSAFLLVTKADALAAQGRLEPALAALQDTAAEQFNRILPLATLDAQAARQVDGSVDRDRLRRSGGQALISAVMHEVKLARQAAQDQADRLLLQYGPAPSAEPAAPRPAAPEPVLADAPAPLEDTPAASAEAPAGRLLSPETRQAYTQALEYLSGQGRSFSQALRDGAAADSGALIRETLRSVQWLDSHLEAHGGGGTALTGMRSAVSEAEDLIQLIQVEQDDTSLCDATSVLLQLKRDMQAQLAA